MTLVRCVGGPSDGHTIHFNDAANGKNFFVPGFEGVQYVMHKHQNIGGKVLMFATPTGVTSSEMLLMMWKSHRKSVADKK